MPGKGRRLTRCDAMLSSRPELEFWRACALRRLQWMGHGKPLSLRKNRDSIFIPARCL